MINVRFWLVAGVAFSVLGCPSTSPNPNPNPEDDDVNPDTSITAGPQGLVGSRDATFEFTGSDNVGVTGFECRLDQGQFETCTSPKSYSGLQDGPHELSVRALDAAGNRDADPARRSWEVDATPPTGSASFSVQRTKETSAYLSVTGEDPHQPIEMKLSGDLAGEDVWKGLEAQVAVTLTEADGEKTVQVSLRDSVGNVATFPATITLDRTGPTVTVDGANANGTTITVTFSSADADLDRFDCSVNGASFTACTSPKTFTAAGPYTFSVRGVDDLGNVGDPAEHSGTSSITWSQVSAGPESTCAIATDGTLWCWGEGISGLRQESTQATNWSQVSVGSTETCAIKTDGTLWCWYATNPPAQEPSNATNWAKVSRGSSFTCALKTDQTLWCWGQNNNGQLGDGSTTQRTAPVQVTTSQWKSFALGANHACGVKAADSTLHCWGANSFGQLGLGGTDSNPHSNPAEVNGGGTWDEVSAASLATCGRKSGGEVFCWGNASGQPTREPSNGTWTAISVGAEHQCATKSDQSLYCWGDNKGGQLGDDSTVSSTTPVREATAATDWTALAAGGRHTCALRTGGALYCWGRNVSGQVGIGSIHAGRLVPTREATGATSWKAVSAGRSHSCATRNDGSLWCWGAVPPNQSTMTYGAFSSGGAGRPKPQGSSDWTALSSGATHSCSIKSSATLWCWGNNGSGQFGNGQSSMTPAYAPVEATNSTPAQGWASSVAAGASHSCARKNDGTLWCWGANSSGQLGDGSNTPRTSAVQVSSSVTGWKSVYAGAAHSCGISTIGDLHCWGLNDAGQLGDGTKSDVNAPKLIGASGVSWDSLSLGTKHTCGLKPDGSLFCWGANDTGQLGDGTNTEQLSPKRLGTEYWKAVAAAHEHTCGVKADGTLWCWGDNSYGQLGNGAKGWSEGKLSPVQEATGATNWAAVSAGKEHTCATKLDGTLWCFGGNGSGQLGDGLALVEAPAQVK